MERNGIVINPGRIDFSWIGRVPNGRPTATHFCWLLCRHQFLQELKLQKLKQKRAGSKKKGEQEVEEEEEEQSLAASHGALLRRPAPISVFFPGGGFLSQATCSSATRHLEQEETTLLQGGHVADGEVRADGEARRWRRRRRVAGPPRHGQLLHRRRRRGLHRQRPRCELGRGDAGADAGTGGDVARRRPGRLLHLPGRLPQLNKPN